MTTKHKVCALQLIDEILGALSRGGPGRGTSFRACRKRAAFFRRYASFLDMHEVLEGKDYQKTGIFTFRGQSAYDALYLSRAYLEVLLDSIPKINRLPLEDQLIFYTVASKWPEDRFVKYAKYCTAYPMARFLRNPLPEKPDGFTGNPLFSGKIKRILKSRIISSCDRNARLFFGILQGVKRGAAVVPESFIQEAMLKHRSALTKQLEGPGPDRDHLTRYAEFFDGFVYPKERLYEASSSASYQSKKSEGGAREFIREEQETGLIKMYEFRPGQTEEVRGAIKPTFVEALRRAKEASRNVMVSAVLEPLKVRLITKGDSYRYWISRYYQKALWKHLQRFPQFVLTGRPLGKGDLLDLLSREKSLGLDFNLWVSGDYSAATDTLDIRHTKASFEASLKGSLFKATPGVHEVLRSVLYEQNIHYPSKYGLEPIQQTTGQLMGSTLSFPILCSVNLIAYWRALERYLGKEVEIPDLPVLINGDDILFRADEHLYDLWQTEITAVGFSLSLGKNYIHPEYFTINSQLYSSKGDDLHRLGYLNAGLLTGQSKITGRSNAKIAPLWDYYNEIVPDSVDPLRTHKRFMHYHKRVISELTLRGQYNLFLEFERGGLGFKPIPGLKIKITSFQRRFAEYLHRKFIQDPSVITKIALVSTLNRSSLKLYHVPRVVSGPKVGPQPRDVVELQEKEVTLPPLALPGDSSEQRIYRVRLPRAKTIREFRKGTYRRMGGVIASFPWKPLEQTFKRYSDESEIEYDWRLQELHSEYRHELSQI